MITRRKLLLRSALAAPALLLPSLELLARSIHGKVAMAGTWILATGFWNDSGTWVDSATWID
jgi:hypothetical protein